ncbi:hypothetical protein GLS40_05290 [Pseudooceanicola sp. 216_PA32_1]|uniref:CsbD-like n=1 Tax=Pseudooceanicola pacificus TaxID=2676438 RepID=A0A844WBQ3_9RHOB|nr:hypothetical protein [Pseudooceanicola pacificus]MWB77432.1 hypothetical protein [Pseudooceanicola pacificus]
MDWTRIKQDWTAFTGAVMERWPEAQEDDLLQLDGTRDALAGYLVQRTGRDAATLQEEISEWREGAEPADIHMDESRDNANIGESARLVAPGEDVYDDDRAFGDDGLAEPPVDRG